MTQINLPNTNITGANLWSQVEDNDQAIVDVVNGDIGSDNLASDAIKAVGAFYAHRTAVQSVAPSDWRHILFTATRFNNNSWFSTANSEYAPQRAGFYRVSASIGFPDGANQYYMALFKNGSAHVLLDAARSDGGANGGRRTTGSALVEMNGTTDKIDIRIYHTAGGSVDAGGGWTTTDATSIYFCGEFVGSP